MPGIENFPPERQETSSGLSVPPNFLPDCSVACRLLRRRQEILDNARIFRSDLVRRQVLLVHMMFQLIHQYELVDEISTNKVRIRNVDITVGEHVFYRLQNAPGEVNPGRFATYLARADEAVVDSAQVIDRQHSFGDADKRQLIAH